MDHSGGWIRFMASEDAESMDGVFWGTEEEIEPYVRMWLHDGKGLLAYNGCDVGIKMRPTNEELSLMSPEYDHRWSTYFANAPDKPVILLLPFATRGPGLLRGKCFSMAYLPLYPVSLGRVHITSGLDPYAKLDFEPGYLNECVDLL